MSYLTELMKVSVPVRRQFEIAPRNGFCLEDIPYSGVDEKLRHKELSKGLERLYPERIVLRVTNQCPAICSFCYEAPRINKPTQVISDKDLDKAISIIQEDKQLDYLLVSGGSPFVLGPKRLGRILLKISEIPHLKQIYVAGSRPIFDPTLWSKEIAEVIQSYQRTDFRNPSASRIVGVSTHFNHPDELTKIPAGFDRNVIHALNEFTSKGIPVYCYSTLLKGINNNAQTLRQLFTTLRQNNVVPYYLIHALDTPWNTSFRVPLQEMADLAKEIEPLSGHVKPFFIVATPIGKISIHGSMKLEYEEVDGKKHVKFWTPYKEKEFRATNRLHKIPPKVTVEKDGRLAILYPDG